LFCFEKQAIFPGHRSGVSLTLTIFPLVLKTILMTRTLLSLLAVVSALPLCAQLDFQDPQSIYSQGIVQKVTYGDFDGDGFKDVAYTTELRPYIYVLFNQGDGTMKESVTMNPRYLRSNMRIVGCV